MLYCLLDGHARTGTELAATGDVTPSTASVHLSRLTREGLLRVEVQGKHRYYRLDGRPVARALEALSVLAGGSQPPFTPTTPHELRAARTCYDHIAGALGVRLHDRLHGLGWIAAASSRQARGRYELTDGGRHGLEKLGVDVVAALSKRRRFAYACLDWSERRPHVGGALGAALLEMALRRGWVSRDPDGRALEITSRGRRELHSRVGVQLAD